MVNFLNKQELKYIAYSVGFAIVWFFILMPYLLKILDGDSIFLNFLVFNLGIMAMLTIYLKAATLSTGINIRAALEYTFVVLSLDILLPAYHISFLKGELIEGAVLGKTSTDYVFGVLAQNIGLSGIFISIFTYILIPAILLFLAAKLSPNFVRRI